MASSRKCLVEETEAHVVVGLLLLLLLLLGSGWGIGSLSSGSGDWSGSSKGLGVGEVLLSLCSVGKKRLYMVSKMSLSISLRSCDILPSKAAFSFTSSAISLRTIRVSSQTCRSSEFSV